MGTKKAPHARKDTFWNKIRVEKGFTIREVSEYLHKSETQTGMFFSGQLMPNDVVCKQLCDLFDVDFNNGNLEFQHAHRAWKAETSLSLKYHAQKKTETSDKFEEVPNTQSEVTDELLKTFIACYTANEVIGEVTAISATLYGKSEFGSYEIKVEIQR